MAVGFGIIGCGMISRFHAKAVADIRGAKVVACYDAVPAAADKFANEVGCRAYHDLEALLADPAVAGVVVTSRDITARLEMAQVVPRRDPIAAVGRIRNSLAQEQDVHATAAAAECLKARIVQLDRSRGPDARPRWQKPP